MIISEENKPDLGLNLKYPVILKNTLSGEIGIFTEENSYVVLVPGKGQSASDVGIVFIIPKLGTVASGDWVILPGNVVLSNHCPEIGSDAADLDGFVVHPPCSPLMGNPHYTDILSNPRINISSGNKTAD